MVKELPVELHRLILSKKSVLEIIHPKSNLIRSEVITIDGISGMMVEVEELLNSSNTEMKVRMLQFMFTHNQKLYCLQGSIGPVEVSKNLDKKYEPLFCLVASGTQIND